MTLTLIRVVLVGLFIVVIVGAAWEPVTTWRAWRRRR